MSLQQLPVITSNTIVRCRSCRTYINPFVSFLDQRRWKCNLCYRVNDGKSPTGYINNFSYLCMLAYYRVSSSRSVPDEFMYNPVTRSYGEPHKRPEVQNSTVEFIASSDYMVSVSLSVLKRASMFLLRLHIHACLLSFSSCGLLSLLCTCSCWTYPIMLWSQAT